MAMDRKVLLLVLLGAVGIHSSRGPSNLTATVNNSRGDFADIDVFWSPGDCDYENFRLFVQASWENEAEGLHVGERSVIVFNKEFWTNYTLVLDPRNCSVGTNLTMEIYTGPGNPHPVVTVDIAPTAVDANITMKEAFMIRPVDRYNATWCVNDNSCQGQLYPRNNQGPPTEFDFKIEGLTPNTPYVLTIYAEILFEGKVFTSLPYPTMFTTLMPPTINAKSSPSSGRKQSIP